MEIQCKPFVNASSVVRGAVVEWLERLAVVRKVAGSRPARAKRLESSHCPPSSEWVPGARFTKLFMTELIHKT